MGPIPSGTITFLFTDIEGSTKLWKAHPEAMKAALARHDEILRSAIESNNGYVFKTIGDAFCAAFRTAPKAVIAITQAQKALQAEDWGEIGTLKVRAALHTGSTDERDGDYFGTPVNRVARLLSAGHGGQTLLSLATSELVRDTLPGGTSLIDLGEHRLKDLTRPEEVFQLATLGLGSDFAVLDTLDTRPNNLPVQPTPFIGRQREIEEVRKLLSRTEVRLVTLTGPGGTGKTRIGLQVAADLTDEHEDGVYFVALDSVTNADLVVGTIARALGLQEGGDLPIEEILKNYLKEKQILLVLDNFEQVIPAASHVADLLAVCPRVRVLATSREILHLRGEYDFPVPPLSLPDRDASAGHGAELVAALSQYEAVRMFIDRAKAIQPDFEVTSKNAPAVAEICHRLDGLPLAIELAVARVRLLTPQKLLERFEKRLPLLTRGAKDLPARQQTLRGAIAWSHDLLEEDERTLFRRLSVFAGGFTLEAAKEVCGRVGEVECDVLDGMASLEEKSLLRQQEGTGDSRFAMLETVREFAQGLLMESIEDEEVSGLYAGFYLSIAERASIRGPHQDDLFRKLRAEHENIRAAMDWAIRTEKPEIALRISGAMADFWLYCGYMREGHAWLMKTLAMQGAPLSGARASALIHQGVYSSLLGKADQGASCCDEGMRISKETDDREGMARAHFGLACVSVANEEMRVATDQCGQSLAAFRLLGINDGIASALHLLGDLAERQDDYTRAEVFFKESLALWRQLANRMGICEVLGHLAGITAKKGNYGRAEQLLKEHLVMLRELGMSTFVAGAIADLGSLAIMQNNNEYAVELLSEGLETLRTRGNTGDIVRSLGLLAEAESNLGNDKVGEKLLKEALSLSLENGYRRHAVRSLEQLAPIAHRLGLVEKSTRLLGAADASRSALGFTRTKDVQTAVDHSIAAAGHRLEEPDFLELWNEGHAMSLEEAVEYALSEDE